MRVSFPEWNFFPVPLSVSQPHGPRQSGRWSDLFRSSFYLRCPPRPFSELGIPLEAYLPSFSPSPGLNKRPMVVSPAKSSSPTSGPVPGQQSTCLFPLLSHGLVPCFIRLLGCERSSATFNHQRMPPPFPLPPPNSISMAILPVPPIHPGFFSTFLERFFSFRLSYVAAPIGCPALSLFPCRTKDCSPLSSQAFL